MTAKKWVQRPHYRSKVEVDRKKEERKSPQDDPDWVFYLDHYADASVAPYTWWEPPLNQSPDADSAQTGTSNKEGGT